MNAHEHTTPEGDTFQLRVVQALDSDPMFTPSRYTISAEKGGDGFEVEVGVAPGYYHFLTRDARRRLPDSAFVAVGSALDTGLREPAEVEIGTSGAVRLHARTIARLL
ncbi:MAG: hypothetical protein GKS06_07765 [Acidobacteria bacterium]|nr:hypothetical protein [Acidobacteriota bacterium]